VWSRAARAADQLSARGATAPTIGRDDVSRPVLTFAAPSLVFLAIGCASQPAYRYRRAAAKGAPGVIELLPGATVGDLSAAIRAALPNLKDCGLWFEATENHQAWWDRNPLVVVSGDLRLPTYAYCEAENLIGSVGVIRSVVLSTDGLSGGVRWCAKGSSMHLATRGTIASLQHDVQRALLPPMGIAWAAWATDDARRTLAIIEQFRAAGVPLLLVDEGRPERRSTDGLHACEPRDDPPDG
jgi:hypothetical protein